MWQVVLLFLGYAFPADLQQSPNNVRIEDHPWQVSIMILNLPICCGVIIRDNIILTAAHCLRIPKTSIRYQIRAGTAKRGEEGGAIATIRVIHIHPRYNSETQDYDFAVAVLETPLIFGPTIGPVKELAEKDDVLYPGQMTILTGWGAPHDKEPSVKHLRKVEVPIVDQEECLEDYNNKWITDRMFCAGYPEGGQDACHGDSGGPIMIGDKLVGIVSWGWGCGKPGYPGVYAKISSVRDWFDAVSNFFM